MTEQRQAILELVANCGLPVHEIAAGDKLFLKGVTIDIQPWADDASPSRVKLQNIAE